ncbi:MAG TPA: hypothetical protein PK992_01570, partial [Planctomycetaceae bacterium]|nr:hypothetical protein [Planctomycetaceae bacterium]
SGGEKSGGEKSGGEKSGGEKSGGESGGKGKGKDGSGDSKKAGGPHGGGKGTGVPSIDPGDSSPAGADEADADGNANGKKPDGVIAPDATNQNQTEKITPDDPQADDAAHAASLALNRLKKELDRGEVNQKLLEELGWTESELKTFVDRMQRQLQERELNTQQQKEKTISQKSFDAMLKGLDINSVGSTREGRTDRDSDQTDTTMRQSTPPARYRQLVEGYQLSISGSKNTNP